MAVATAPGPQFSPVEYALNASALSGALSALVLDRADGRLVVSRADLVGHATNLVLDSLGLPPSGT
jgi:hypothetical protein